jgi:hypothetical protein
VRYLAFCASPRRPDRHRLLLRGTFEIEVDGRPRAAAGTVLPCWAIHSQPDGPCDRRRCGNHIGETHAGTPKTEAVGRSDGDDFGSCLPLTRRLLVRPKQSRGRLSHKQGLV